MNDYILNAGNRFGRAIHSLSFSKVARHKDGTYESVKFNVGYGSVRQFCQPEVADGCQREMEQIVSTLEKEGGLLKSRAIDLMLKLAREKLFPEIDDLSQFSADTKAKTKELVTRAIQKGSLTSEEREISQDDNGKSKYGTFYYFTYAPDPIDEIRQLNFVIP